MKFLFIIKNFFNIFLFTFVDKIHEFPHWSNFVRIKILNSLFFVFFSIFNCMNNIIYLKYCMLLLIFCCYIGSCSFNKYLLNSFRFIIFAENIMGKYICFGCLFLLWKSWYIKLFSYFDHLFISALLINFIAQQFWLFHFK